MVINVWMIIVQSFPDMEIPSLSSSVFPSNRTSLSRAHPNKPFKINC